MTDLPPCRWSKTAEARLLPARHADGCYDTRCRGCLPCPERHCQVCRREHVTVATRGTDQTCAGCLATVRTHLAETVRMSAALLGQAIVRGINSEAAALVAPTADVEAWGHRRMSALARRIDPSWLADQVDVDHPAWVLGTWDLMARDHLGHDRDSPTMSEVWAYLDEHLTRLAHADREAFGFSEMAADIARVRHHLAQVLNLEETPTRGPSCYACGHPHLIEDHGDADDPEVLWICPKCERWWRPEARDTVARGIRVQVAESLTIGDMTERTGVPAGTLRRWLYGYSRKRKDGTTVRVDPLVEPTGTTEGGAHLFKVADVVSLRDERAKHAVR